MVDRFLNRHHQRLHISLGHFGVDEAESHIRHVHTLWAHGRSQTREIA